MDTRTGKILDREAFEALADERKKHFIQIQTNITPKQAKARKVGRNDPCPCGSGEKFKRCHYTGGSYLRRKANALIRKVG